MLWLAAGLLSFCAVLLLGQNVVPISPDQVSEQLNQCVSGGRTIDSCLVTMFEELKPAMKVGYPALNIPPTDPMVVGRVVFALENLPIMNVTTTFTDATIRGLSTYTLQDIHADKAAKTIRLRINVDELNSSGNYAIEGFVFTANLKRSFGPYSVKYNGVSLDGLSYLEKRDGKVRISNYDVKVDVKGIDMKLENLFGGSQPILNATVHNFINHPDNTPQFIKDFQPEISKQVGGILAEFLDQSLKRMDPNLFV